MTWVVRLYAYLFSALLFVYVLGWAALAEGLVDSRFNSEVHRALLQWAENLLLPAFTALIGAASASKS